MTTAIIVIGVLVVAAAAAALFKSRRPDVPTSANFVVPQQIDREDFGERDQPWLFVLFSSKTCQACFDARNVVQVEGLQGVGSVEVLFETARDVHTRYAIDSVPTVLLADSEGVVHWSFVGPPPPEAIRDVLIDIGAAPPDDGTSVAIS